MWKKTGEWEFMGYVEDLILRHSYRGMDVLRPYLPENFCRETAEAILRWQRGTVLLTTGFYVGGTAETDGPPGTLLLAKALKEADFSPLVVTDEWCRGYFERGGIPCAYLSVNAGERECRELLERVSPVGMISVERCGRNEHGDYANMNGRSIAVQTAPVDRLFEMARVPTVGIGDGGNEIGMGNLRDVIQTRLALQPSRVTVDRLVIATVSNWGALGLCACMGRLPSADAVEEAYTLAVEMGYVDGLTGVCCLSEDGFPLRVLRLLRQELEAVSRLPA